MPINSADLLYHFLLQTITFSIRERERGFEGQVYKKSVRRLGFKGSKKIQITLAAVDAVAAFAVVVTIVTVVVTIFIVVITIVIVVVTIVIVVAAVVAVVVVAVAVVAAIVLVVVFCCCKFEILIFV